MVSTRQHKIRSTRLVMCLGAIVLGTGMAVAEAAEKKITTADGDGADSEVRFNHNDVRDLTTGEDAFFSVRYYPSDGEERNEFGLLRFDLTGVDPRSITNAQLQLTTHQRNNKASFIIYGLKHTTPNQRWDERKVFAGPAPGLRLDSKDYKARAINEAETVKLGVMQVPASDAETVLKFASEPLKKFLQDETWSTRSKDRNLVTFILTLEKPSRGRRVICTKEFEDEDNANAPRLLILTR